MGTKVSLPGSPHTPPTSRAPCTHALPTGRTDWLTGKEALGLGEKLGFNSIPACHGHTRGAYMLGDCWGTKDRVAHPENPLKRQEIEAPRAAKRVQVVQPLNSEPMLSSSRFLFAAMSQQPLMASAYHRLLAWLSKRVPGWI